MLPSSNQTLVVGEMNCLRDDWIPSREPPFSGVSRSCALFFVTYVSLCFLA